MKIVYRDEKRSFELETTTADESREFTHMFENASYKIIEGINAILLPMITKSIDDAKKSDLR